MGDNVFLDVYFLLSGNKIVQFFKRSIKKIAPAFLISKVLINLKQNTSYNYFFDHASGNKPKVLVFFCPDYGNLGDVGIYIAQKNFLEENLPQSEIIDIPVNKTLEGISWFRKRVQTNDLIVMSGGGFFGDLYPLMEHYRQMIVKYFPTVSIISFPQSTFFSDTDKGLKLLKRSCKIYNHHPGLTLIGRDNHSYLFIQKHFPGSSAELLPDIVLSMNKSEDHYHREGVIFCWRRDFESVIGSREKSCTEGIIKKHWQNVNYMDTIIESEDMSIGNLFQCFEGMIQIFKSAELVVTDRLHGMLFCYLTNTPCIAINDKNDKVANSYQTWLKDVPYVKLFSPGVDLNDLNRFSETVRSGKITDTSTKDFRLLFDALRIKLNSVSYKR